MLMQNVVVSPPPVIQRQVIMGIQAKEPIMVHGRSGQGKTQLMKQIAKALGMVLSVYLAITLNPTDPAGIMYIDPTDNTAKFSRPPLMPDPLVPTLIFFDEFNRAPKLVQNALLKAVNERTFGDYKIPDNCAIVAAVNDLDIGIEKMSDAGLDRWTHLYMETTAEAWLQWGQSAGINPYVLHYVKRNPGKFNTAKDPNQHAQTTPRAYERLSNYLNMFPDMSEEDGPGMCGGSIGYGIGLEFWSTMAMVRSWPTTEEILKDPAGVKVPVEEPSIAYMLAMALSRQITTVNYDKATIYLDRLPDDMHVLAVEEAVKRDPALINTPEYSQYKVKFQVAAKV